MSNFQVFEFKDRDEHYNRVINRIKDIDKDFSDKAKVDSTIIIFYKEDNKDKVYVNTKDISENLVKNIICTSLYHHIKNKQMKYQIIKRDGVFDWESMTRFDFKDEKCKSSIFFVVNLDKIFTLKKKLPSNIKQEITNVLNLIYTDNKDLVNVNYSNIDEISKLLSSYKQSRFNNDTNEDNKDKNHTKKSEKNVSTKSKNSVKTNKDNKENKKTSPSKSKKESKSETKKEESKSEDLLDQF